MKTPADIRRIEQLFHHAVALDGPKRASFVAQVRSSDPDLAGEIESLLEAHSRDGSFMNSPAYDQAATLIVDSDPSSPAGRSLGRYQVLSQVGRGGMGEVYLAEDSQLGRKVALKLLPARLTDNKDRLRRFVQEARAASALNHPNIITIHEVGESDGTHFIATEFIEGQTLRQRISEGPLALTELLDIAIQVAGAVEAAHEAGIIHRDIKPENIMLRRDGYAKVLDFGLAKLTERSSPEVAADSSVGTAAFGATQPGIVLGTVNYMSPEQARGRLVDARSDIFSLGLVVYEMATGHKAFSGETMMDVVAAILEKDPAQLSRFVPDAPAELQRIVTKALRKDRDERYQTTRDLLLDLKNLKEEIAFDEKLARSRGPGATKNALKKAAGVNQPGRVASGRENHTRAAGVVIVALVIALSVAVAILWPRLRPASGPSTSGTSAEVAGPARALSYWIMVQKYRDGRPYQEPIRLRDDINFEKDYRIRLNISSAQSGYLYLLNEGPEANGDVPSFVVMFPSATTNQLSARLAENQQIQVPEQSWFQFDDQEGTEKLWLVWADRSVDELEAVKRFSNQRDKGLLGDPELRARVYEFLKSRSSIKPSVERDDNKAETALSAGGDMLVHVIKLSHH